MRRILEAIRTSSETEKNDLVQQIRRSVDPAEVLQIVPLLGSSRDDVPSAENVTVQSVASSYHGPSPPMTSSYKGSVYNDLQPDIPSEQKSHPHLSVSHKILLWPEVFHCINGSEITEAVSDLRYVSMLGTPWLLEKDRSPHRQKLTCNVGLERKAISSRSVVYPSLTIQKMGEYSAAYFSTFNTMFPLLILEDFKDNIVAKVLLHGYGEDDPEGVIALLVFALGQLAMEGASDQPADGNGGARGSVHCSTSGKPSGLKIFNEARRRTGTIVTRHGLLDVQILLLQASYYQACAQHADFWSSVSAASMACRYLLRSQSMDWSSTHGDLVKRAYWVCVLHERLLDVDLKIACTGIEALEGQVPLPRFNEYVPRGQRADGSTSDSSRLVGAEVPNDYAYQFSALVALSRLLRQAEDIVHDWELLVGDNESLWQEAKSQDHVDAPVDVVEARNYKDPPSQLIEALIGRLQSWRAALPLKLQWKDGDKFDFQTARESNSSYQRSIWNQPAPLGPGGAGYDLDMAVAQLGTRFYHTQFLIHRPFVYKALHFPQTMTADDRVKCGYALKTACTWSRFLLPSSHWKHLVPHLFAWTQNFMAMLCIICMCQRDGFVSEICSDSGISREEIRCSSMLMAEWLEDVRRRDVVADWNIRILRPLL